jgi:hypothetical protein
MIGHIILKTQFLSHIKIEFFIPKVRAMAGLSGVKQCDGLIKALSAGEPVSLNDLPVLPAARDSGVQEASMQVSNVSRCL